MEKLQETHGESMQRKMGILKKLKIRLDLVHLIILGIK